MIEKEENLSISNLNNSMLIVSTLASAFDIYCVLSGMYWVSVIYFPQSYLLAIELFAEFLFLFNMMVQWQFQSSPTKDLQDNETTVAIPKKPFSMKLKKFLIRTSGLPIITILEIVGKAWSLNLDNGYYSLVFVLKLLRVFNALEFISKTSKFLIYSNFQYLVYFKIIENLFIMLMLNHLSSCTWLIVNKIEQLSGGKESYFQRSDEMNQLERYIDSLNWGIQTMNGGSFGDVTPQKTLEYIVSVVFMLVGGTFFAKIFSDFEKILYIRQREKIERNKLFDEAKNFCLENKVNYEAKRKIREFFSHKIKGYYEAKNWNAIQEFPLSLKTEISLYLNEKMIKDVKLFKMSAPSFLLALSKHLYPSLCMSGDMVIRSGEIPEKFYIIKSGKVEIIATDNKTRIAILEEGAYFGEIALLVTSLRSANVKALSNCIFACIDKDHFLKIMELFPQQKEYLLKISKQRLMTSTYEDLNARPDGDNSNASIEKSIIGDSSDDNAINDSSDGDSESSLKGSNTKVNSTNGFQKRRTIINISNGILDFQFGLSISMNNKLTIKEFSIVYYYWVYILSIVFLFVIFYIPYTFFFGMQDDIEIFIDLIICLLYLFDAFIHYRTRNSAFFAACRTDEGKRKAVTKLKECLVEDLMAFMPIEIILNLLGFDSLLISFFRLIHLMKYNRFIRIWRDIKAQSDTEHLYSKLMIKSFLFLYFNHMLACFMYAIAKIEYDRSPGKCMIAFANKNLIDEEKPFVSKSQIEIYLNFLYWALCTSSSGVYGDIIAVTPVEKVIQLIGMFFFKFYTALLAAEVTSIMSNIKLKKQEYHNKVNILVIKKIFIMTWCRHNNIPDDLIERVKKYLKISAQKMKTLENSNFSPEIPKTLREEILMEVLKDLVTSLKKFPKDDHGIMLSVVRKLKIIVYPKNEFVFRLGEVASEMYFIVEGSAEVILPDGSIVATLQRKDFFGEMGIIQGTASTRTAAVRAKTNLSLAIFSLADYKEIVKTYPNVQTVLMETIEKRKQKNIEAALQKKQGKILNPTVVFSEQSPPKSQKPKLDSIVRFQQKIFIQDKAEYFTFKPTIIKQIKEKEELEKLKKIGSKGKLKLGILTKLKLKSLNVKRNIKERKQSEDEFLNENYENENENEIEKLKNEDQEESLSQIENIDLDSPENSIRTVESIIHGLEMKNFIDSMESSYILDNGFIENSVVKISLFTRVIEAFIFKCKSSKMILKLKDSFESKFLNAIIHIFFIVFIPLQISFTFMAIPPEYLPIMLLIELCYIHNKLKEHKEKRRNGKKVIIRRLSDINIKVQQNPWKKRLRTFVKDFVYIIYIFPYYLVLNVSKEKERGENFFLFALQMLRLCECNRWQNIFGRLKSKKEAFATVLEIIMGYALFCHISACVFVTFGNFEGDPSRTWLRKIPAPQPNYTQKTNRSYDISAGSIYIHALYWAYVTTSHIGFGDVAAVNWIEKFISCVIIFLGILVWVLFFGNIVSIIEDIKPIIKTTMQQNYKRIRGVIESIGLFGYLNKFDQYFSYLWIKNKGIDENNLLFTLPSGIRVDLQIFRYREVMGISQIFRINGVFNEPIAISIFNKLHYEIFLQDEIVISAGQECNKIYILLEGEAVLEDFDGKEVKKLFPGSYFGEVAKSERFPASIITTKICRFGILSELEYDILSDAFPEWRHSLVNKHRKFVNSTLKAIDFYRKPLNIQKGTTENNFYVTDDLLSFYLYRRNREEEDSPEDFNIPLQTEENIENTFLRNNVKKISTMSIDETEDFSRMEGVFFKRDTEIRRSLAISLQSMKTLLEDRGKIEKLMKNFLILSCVHLLWIWYTVIALPFYVGFNSNITPAIFVLEILCHLDSFVFLIYEIIVYKKVKRKISPSGFGSNQSERVSIFHIILDIIGIFPMNITLSADHHGSIFFIFSILKILRMVQVIRFFSIFTFLESQFKNLSEKSAIIKSTLFLLLVWHWSTCLWIYFNLNVESRDISWLVKKKFSNESEAYKYLLASTFVINITSTTGYPELIVWNDLERVFLIFLVFVGNGVFGCAFGILSSHSNIFSPEAEHIYEYKLKMNKIYSENNVPYNLKKKIDEYISFLVSNKAFKQNQIRQIKDIIPPHLVNSPLFSMMN